MMEILEMNAEAFYEATDQVKDIFRLVFPTAFLLGNLTMMGMLLVGGIRRAIENVRKWINRRREKHGKEK